MRQHLTPKTAVTVAIVLAIGAFAKPLIARLPAAIHYVAPYAIGTVAMFWVIDRVGAF